MKLSAPPPPPPQPTQEGPATPTDNPEANNTTSTPPEATPPTPPADAAKPATWPAWFSGTDFVIAVFAIVLAFLASSFVARNSDVYLHLAAGQRLLAGTYTPGSDPFSFAAADRAWVNHSLLYDVGSYLLYSGNGATLVVLKAVAVAVAFGLLIGLRRPGASLWPWAMVAVVGVIAAAPYLHLRPVVASVLLLAVTLFLLFRVPHQSGSWRFPTAIGVTFWVWSNTDEWFFLGPMALTLVLIGELIQKSLRGETATASSPEAETLGVLPDVKTLARALGIGIVVCMLNPHHVRVWELPFELVGAKDVADDPRFKQLLVTPLDTEYTEKAHLGYNLNGLAFALLFVGGGAALGLAGSRVRFSLIALWVGFALLSLGTVHAIPFLAVLAVPVMASQLNAFSSGIVLKTWGDPRSRILLLGSSVGRVLSVIFVLGACVWAWPGWIQLPTNNPAFTRRVAWGIEPDAGMAKGAEQLQAMRKSGQLPAEAHGFVTLLDFANYCAWYAPDEKVYANSRFNHHRPEFPGYMTIRRGMQLVLPTEQRSQKESRALNDAANEILQSNGIEYVVLHASPSDSPYIRPPGGPMDWEVRGYSSIATVLHWVDPDHWSPWYLDGRTSISGWRSKPGSEKPTFTALQLRPTNLAFGPMVEQLPAGAVQQIPPYGGWEEAFVRSPALPPIAADDSLIWHAYLKIGEELQQNRELMVRFTGHTAERIAGTSGLLSRLLPLTPPNDLRASAFLSLRAARRAIAVDPNHPDGYFALFRALEARELPLLDADRTIAQITALRQCLERMPPPEEFKLGVYAALPSQVSLYLLNLYLAPQPLRGGGASISGIPVNSPAFFGILTARFGATVYLFAEGNRVVRKPAALAFQGGQGQQLGGPFLLPLDVAREVVLKAQDYARAESTNPEATEKLLTTFKNIQKFFETDLAQANNAYESRRASQKPPLPGQIQMALQNNLVGEALKLLTAKDVDLGKEFGPALLDFLLLRISLELAVGRIEDAAADLEQLATDAGVQKGLSDSNLRGIFQLLMYQKYTLEGNYIEAGRLLEELDGSKITNDLNKTARDQFDRKPFQKFDDRTAAWLLATMSPNTFDAVVRAAAPVAGLYGFEYMVSPTEPRVVPGYATFHFGLKNFRKAQSDFFLARGMLFLYEGDMASARKRFLQTRLPAVPEWDLPESKSAIAELYIRLIGEAEKAAPAK